MPRFRGLYAIETATSLGPTSQATKQVEKRRLTEYPVLLPDQSAGEVSRRKVPFKCARSNQGNMAVSSKTLQKNKEVLEASVSSPN